MNYANFKTKIIGAGAGGNKAVIDAINNGVISKENSLLINSTAKDIQSDFEDISLIFDNADGVGKERSYGKKLMYDTLSNRGDELQKFIEDCDNVVIVTSTEGGTGSSSSVILADMCVKAFKKSVNLIAFDGFGKDPRSLSNSVEFAKDLSEAITFTLISNKKYESQCKTLSDAEKMANKDFVEMLKTITAHSMKESETNIDSADLRKLVTTTGYLSTYKIGLKDIKNEKEYNDVVENAYYDSKIVETEKGGSCKGLIFYISPATGKSIDWSHKTINEIYGETFEVFTHIQEEEDDERLEIIINGQKLPTKHYQKLSKEYLELSANLNKEKDSFFDEIGSINGSAEDNKYNMLEKGTSNSKINSIGDYLKSANNIDGAY